ncbi:hypothetical protein BC835DRAFT_1419915 [Cytidiella melzeri]|nr:hypothetical protein BC835DRAFT_1419915 [Cytidiella melzeri]
MHFPNSLILFAAAVTGAFYTVTVSATPYGTTESLHLTSFGNLNRRTTGTGDFASPNVRRQNNFIKRALPVISEDEYLITLYQSLRDRLPTPHAFSGMWRWAQNTETKPASDGTPNNKTLRDMWDFKEAVYREFPANTAEGVAVRSPDSAQKILANFHTAYRR